MSLSLDRMRALVRKGLGGLDATDLPDEDCDELLNLSLWELDATFDFKEKECIIRTDVILGQRDYGLPNSTDAIISAAIIDQENDHRKLKLEKISFDKWQERPDTEALATHRAFPTHYIRRYDTIMLDPVPDESSRWILEVVMWKTCASLLEGTVDEPCLPRNWHEIVVEGAIVRGHFYNEDYNLAQQAQNFPVGKIRQAVSTNAKEDGDFRYAGVKVLRGWPKDEVKR